MTPEELVQIEAIKQLKARYCRYLDTKDWTAWRGIFTDDFHSDTAESGGKVIDGADEFVAFTRKSLRNQATVHQVHAPEIELTSATTARGVWALEDVVRLGPGVNLRGYGHYHETYAKSDGQWRIKSSKLTRLRVDIFNGLVAVYISDRINKVLKKAFLWRADAKSPKTPVFWRTLRLLAQARWSGWWPPRCRGRRTAE